MYTKTAEILEAIKQDESKMIAPSIYTWAFGRCNNVSAAFRIAKQQGIIEVDYIGGTGTPVYKRVA